MCDIGGGGDTRPDTCAGLKTMLRRLLFHQFGLVYRISVWFSRHFSPLGHFLLGLLMVSAAFGANTRAATTYQLAALLAGLFCMGLLWSFIGRKSRLGLSVERLIPLHGTVDEPMRYQITLRNTGKRTERGLSMMDQLAVNFPDWDEFAATTDPTRRNPFDRYVGFHRWQNLMRSKRGASIVERPLPDLPPNQRISLSMELTPLRRGRLQFAGVCIFRPEPFGLFRTLHLIPLPKVCCVLPKRYPASQLPSSGGRSYQRGGVALANAVGESEEFLSLREFRSGDVPRNIHWRSSAKLGRLVVKEFQDEYFVRSALVLDTFLTSPRPLDFEAAISVAASMVNLETQRDSLLDLMFVEQQAHCFTAGRGLAGTMELLEVLAGVQPAGDGSFEYLAQNVMQRADHLSSVVCVLLAWDQARQHLIEHLLAYKMPVAVLLVQEQAPDWQTKPNLFLRHLHPSQIATDLQWN